MARLTRRDLLAAAAAAGMVGCESGGSSPVNTGGPDDTDDTGSPLPDTGTTSSGRPANIVLLFSDQHRAPMLGSFGHPIVQSPHLDALAAESVRFEQMFCNAPLCRPARATFMSGLLPHLHGCWFNQEIAPPDTHSHVRRIRDEAGYHTAVIGKTHLVPIDGHPSEEPSVGRLAEWGFEHSFELLSQPSTATVPNAYADWLLETTPTGESPNKAERYRQYQDDFWFLDSTPPDLDPYRLSTDDHLDTYCGRQAAAWLAEEAPADRPFYLQINFPGPHKPFDSTSEFRALYDTTDSAFEPSILGAPENAGRLVHWIHPQKGLQGMTAEESKFLLMTYYAKITLIDAVIGEIVEVLRATGRLEDTWIIYASDHGDLLGDHEIWGKNCMYEGSLRVPLFIRPPGGVDPWAVQGMVDQLDLASTILEMTGLGPDGEQGRSLLPQVLGGADAPDAQRGKDAILAMHKGQPGTGELQTGCIREERYKLVYDFDIDQAAALYDLDEDPDEKINLVTEPGLTTKRDELVDRLLDSIADDLASTTP